MLGTGCFQHEITCEHKITNLKPKLHFLGGRGGAGWYVFHGLFGRTFTVFVAMNTLDLARHMSNNIF